MAASVSTIDSPARWRGPRGSSDASAAHAVAQHEAVDEAHDVERRAVHVGVVAEAERGSDGHGVEAERGDDAVLTAHVVGGGQHVAERRPAQHEARAVGAVTA